MQRVALRLVAVVIAAASLLVWNTAVRAATPPTLGDILTQRARQFTQLNVAAWDASTERLQHALGIKTATDYEQERVIAELMQLIRENEEKQRQLQEDVMRLEERLRSERQQKEKEPPQP
jgi:hypothetical protein